MNYPKNFTVKGDEYTWHVKQIEEDSWDWSEVNVGRVGSYSSKDMDDMNRKELAFLFPEPDLVFPFSYMHKHGDDGATVEKIGGKIKFNFIDGDFAVDLWVEEEIKKFIKDGDWIVKSVGQQKPAEAPTSTESNPEGLSIKLDLTPVTEATEALNKLAEAAKAAQVAIANLKLSFD